MFRINEDGSIHLTRGDVANIVFDMTDSEGQPYVFAAGDVVRLMIFEKRSCDRVVLSKSVEAVEGATSVTISLSTEETRIGDVLNKPKNYWYEIELNPDTRPQTIIGYDENGPKIFTLFPEGVYRNEY